MTKTLRGTPLCGNPILNFCHLNLFRISNFGFFPNGVLLPRDPAVGLDDKEQLLNVKQVGFTPRDVEEAGELFGRPAPLEIPETGTIIEKARFLKGLAQSI